MTPLPPVELVRIGSEGIGDAVIEHVRLGLEAVLGVHVREGERIPLPIEEQGSANRIRSGALLDRLVAARPDRRIWHLGITAVDLSAPEREWVFGEATVGGAWALVGIARFGIPADPAPGLLRRALTESLHEIGHLAGLRHCDDRSCVMSASARVRDVDAKKSEFCRGCASRLWGTKDP